jgi:hypothetical protein
MREVVSGCPDVKGAGTDDSPVESSSFFGSGDVVVDRHFDGIAPVALDQWLGMS